MQNDQCPISNTIHLLKNGLTYYILLQRHWISLHQQKQPEDIGLLELLVHPMLLQQFQDGTSNSGIVHMVLDSEVSRNDCLFGGFIQLSLWRKAAEIILSFQLKQIIINANRAFYWSLLMYNRAIRYHLIVILTRQSMMNMKSGRRLTNQRKDTITTSSDTKKV